MIKKIKTFGAILGLAFLVPITTFAQVTTGLTGVSNDPVGPTTLASIINLVILYLGQILLLLMAIAVVMFVWNVIKYFIKADADRAAAGQYVMYSLIGFFVILSLWGIINIFGNSFGIGNANNQQSSLDNIKNLLPR